MPRLPTVPPHSVRFFFFLFCFLFHQADSLLIDVLVYAASKGHLDVVEFLLEQKARVDAADKHQNTALLRGAKYPSIVKTLLAHKADVTRANKIGDTALHMACEEGSEEACVLLLAAGADANARNDEGQSPKDLAGKALAHVFAAAPKK